MDIVNARDDFGAIGDGRDDTAALQDAIDACFGSASTPNGTNYALNKVLFIPNGHYKTTAPLILTKLQGAKIYGSGRFTTTIENITGGEGTGDVFRSNGMGYSSISDMQLICHEDGICLDLDWDGESGGAALQANTIESIFCLGSGEEGTIGVRVGQSGFMGSECIFKMLHTQTCKTAGVLINNYNALQHQFYGGQDQGCGIGIWITVGSAPVISGRGFQQQDDCDIKISGAVHNCMSVVGCRSESSNFIINEGGRYLDVSACIQTAASEPGYFVRSSGMTSIRACESNGIVSPYGPCKLTLENSWVGLLTDATELWWLPNNDDQANIFIRNCWVDEWATTTFLAEERRYTEDGVDVLVATYVPGTYGPVVVSTGGGGGGTSGNAFTQSYALGSTDSGWQGYTFIQVFPAASLANFTGSKVSISIEFNTGGFPTAGSSTAVVYFGQQGAGDAYDFTGTQVQLLWSASGTLNATGADTFTSDQVTLGEAFDNTKNYVLAVQFAGSSSINFRRIALSGANSFYKAGTDASTTNKSGYSANFTDTVEFVTSIDIYT